MCRTMFRFDFRMIYYVYNRFKKPEEDTEDELEKEVREEIAAASGATQVSSESSEVQGDSKSKGNKEKIGFRDRKVTS